MGDSSVRILIVSVEKLVDFVPRTSSISRSPPCDKAILVGVNRLKLLLGFLDLLSLCSGTCPSDGSGLAWTP